MTSKTGEQRQRLDMNLISRLLENDRSFLTALNISAAIGLGKSEPVATKTKTFKLLVPKRTETQ
jgi:hypothetical protein